jgi:O-antigen/teichoic acid export membrane protein
MENNLENLGKRSIKGGFWVFSIRIIGNGFGIVRLIILARILAPEDFGVMGIAMLTMTVLETFSQTGFHAALVQKKTNIKPYLNAAWTFLVIRGFIIFAILFFSAPLVSIFFKSPLAKPVIQVLGIYAVIQALTNIGVVYFEKELEFNKQFIFKISGTIVDLFVSIILSILLKSVWALVYGLLAGQITLLFVSYIIHPFRPKLSFNWKQVKELFGFGKWILGSSILGFIVKQGDDIVVGKVISASALGLYQMAFRLSNLPATEITQVISKVTFAAYSKIQDNVARLRNAFTRTLRMVSFVSFPLGGGMFIIAAETIRVFLGDKWMPMVPAFQILCLTGVLRSITANFGSVFNSTGRPDIQTKASLINTLVIIITIYPLVKHFGIVGAVYSRMLTFITQFYTWPKVLKILQMKLKDILKTFLLPLISTLVMILAVFMAKNIFHRLNLVNVLSLIGVGMVVYFTVLFLLDKIFNYGIKEELRAIVKGFK